MLAGGFALSKKQDYKNFYIKKFKTIVLPTLIFSVLYLLFAIAKIIATYFVNGTEIFSVRLINVFISFITGNCGYHMWYLYMIIFIYAITPILYNIKVKIGDKNFNKLGFFLLIISIPFAITSSHKFNYDIGFSIYYVGYFILGYTLKSAVAKKSNKKFIKYFVLAVVILFINSLFRLNNINQGILDAEFKLPFLGEFSILGNFNVLVVIASIMMYKAFVYLDIKKDFSKVTKYSLYIYLIHVFVLDILYIIIMLFKSIIIPYIGIPLYTIVVFICSLLLSKLYLYIYKKIDNRTQMENKIVRKFENLINYFIVKE